MRFIRIVLHSFFGQTFSLDLKRAYESLFIKWMQDTNESHFILFYFYFFFRCTKVRNRTNVRCHDVHVAGSYKCQRSTDWVTGVPSGQRYSSSVCWKRWYGRYNEEWPTDYGTLVYIIQYTHFIEVCNVTSLQQITI